MDNNRSDQTQNPDEMQDVVVIEDEVVSMAEQPADVQSQASIVISLEELIKTNIDNIERDRDELKKLKEMHDDAFAGNPTLREHEERAKESSKKRNETRQQIASQPSVADLANKIKNSRQDMKERQGALSDYLQEYQRLTGATEIEGNDGKIRRIVNTSKLVV